MTPEHMRELAERLATARREGRQLAALPPALLPANAAEGYAVNQRVAACLGWEPLGWKIAATTPAMQARLRTDQPIYGRTYRRFALPSLAVLAHAALLDPLVECEFFVTLGADLPPRAAPWTMAEILPAVARVEAGIEVAECRFPMAALPPVPAILADGSASGHYVFGGEIAAWRDGLAAMEVVLEVDGAARRRGSGAEVMGDPLAPLLWLAEERRRWGDGLRAGEVVSTGTATGMFPVRAGQEVRAVFGEVAEVRISFAAA
ncbi:2-keto-4-pentenoate hydratase [Siccirubricoccus phaeus]|uniref:2-keto-4-pentenoate hydratase n=1 Tax=Siccirubricoccus phaeus TaxID=2595053 RepID=UPI0011F3E33B|nr:fumarylacetoacetate hydrolase family protein [Siccirubricoccus phaeus]